MTKNTNTTAAPKIAYLVKFCTDPIAWGFGKHDAMVNACEAWESFKKGDEIEVLDWEEKPLGRALIVDDVRANILAVDFIPEDGSTFSIRLAGSNDDRPFIMRTSEGLAPDFGGTRKATWKTFAAALRNAKPVENWGVEIVEDRTDGIRRIHSREKLARRFDIKNPSAGY
jgi:hypothetical protein